MAMVWQPHGTGMALAIALPWNTYTNSATDGFCSDWHNPQSNYCDYTVVHTRLLITAQISSKPHFGVKSSRLLLNIGHASPIVIGLHV